MKSVLRTLAALAVAVLLAAGARAEDKKEVKKGAAKPKRDPFAAVFSFPKSITLDDAQKAKVEALRKEYTPKMEAAQAKFEKIMTPERRKAQAEAIKAARAAGKKGRELGEAANAALKLSPEEQAQMKELNQGRIKLFMEIQKKKMELLTPEQREAVRPKKRTEKKEK